MSKLQIQKVWIEHRHDDNGCLEDLGTFTDKPDPTVIDRAIIRVGPHKGKLASAVPGDEWPARCRECRFFVPAMTGEATGNPESPMQDWQRAETCGDTWNYIGVIAKCEILNPDTHVVQTIHSGGLWGVASDSGDHLGEVAKDELASLKTELLALNLGERAIAYAFANIQKTPVAR